MKQAGRWEGQAEKELEPYPSKYSVGTCRLVGPSNLGSVITSVITLAGMARVASMPTAISWSWLQEEGWEPGSAGEGVAFD